MCNSYTPEYFFFSVWIAVVLKVYMQLQFRPRGGFLKFETILKHWLAKWIHCTQCAILRNFEIIGEILKIKVSNLSLRKREIKK